MCLLKKCYAGLIKILNELKVVWVENTRKYEKKLLIYCGVLRYI